MYNQNRNRSLILLFSSLFLFLTLIWLIPPTLSLEDNINSEFENFKNMIYDSSDDCWRKPAQKRKSTMLDKVEALENLVLEGDAEEAYDKLLHDLKPKLTGLKTDENGNEWANGIYKNSWVQCDSLKEAFRIICNDLLMKLNPLYAYDDTPPVIDIDYEGEATVDDPGVWIIYIEDLESGLKEVEILLDEAEEVYETDLNGINSVLYLVNVPAVEGYHTLIISAISNDVTPDTASSSASIEIQSGGPGGGPIIIG